MRVSAYLARAVAIGAGIWALTGVLPADAAILFGMSPVPLPVGGETPVAIDPTTGIVTGLTPATSFSGSGYDVVSSANTLYFLSATDPSLLWSVDETTGVKTFTFLSAPVTDMTVAVTGASTVPEPPTALLLLLSLAGLIGVGGRRSMALTGDVIPGP